MLRSGTNSTFFVSAVRSILPGAVCCGAVYTCSTLRNKMYQNIINYNINRSFSNREHFIDLMTSTDNTVLRFIGLFVSESNIS